MCRLKKTFFDYNGVSWLGVGDGFVYAEEA
jgi:hypothetical protein